MFYHIYSLIAEGQLNAHAAEFHRYGALIMTDEGGVGCIHPWPELGDATLDEELEALKAGSPLTLGKRALKCANVDADARHKGINLLHGLNIPESHATLPPCVSPASVRIMGINGFRAGKLKAMSSPKSTLERLATLASIAPNWRWRIDFNSSLNEREADEFWREMSPSLRQLVDFVEDPCPYTRESWSRLMSEGMRLAYDQGSDLDHQPHLDTTSPPIRIIKPAREKMPSPGSGKHVFTSFMDHPIGQLWATYTAAQYYQDTPSEEIPLCGLCTHLLFKKDAFIEALGGLAPVITVPEGTGLGYDDLLAALPWKKLE
ncbi:hypothetical protein QET40_02930 [Akkermansia sp. N21169]|uniref:hypothetical protein n=1 Tax=unclassified Akkermansia TaxID=2608915 RepID=UPI00244E5E16|nr:MULTISPECIES: hypothetical protein [unclassified Akkermansia]MDH3068057.1 hypothetical protein [Akkermansia sp. N21169]WPX39526.1 hypothetical protein QET93_008255 [Akkermansia sp. N21116]